MSLHRGRKQLLQHQQSVLSVQQSVAYLRQELQDRTQLLQVGTPSIFTSVTAGGKGLGLGDCTEGGDLLGPQQTYSGGRARLPSYGSYYKPKWKKGPMGGGEPSRGKGE